MRKLRLKNIVIITSLAFILTGCVPEVDKIDTSKKHIINNNSYTQTDDNRYENEPPTYQEPTYQQPEYQVPSQSTSTKEEFTFFQDARREIISYIDSEEFEMIKTKGKYYLTTGIDFIFFGSDINGVRFSDLTDSMKEQAMRDLESLDKAICAYYPDYKEDISAKYQVAAEFVSAKYVKMVDAIREYLGSENFNSLIEIKDQIGSDLSDVKDEAIDDIKEFYNSWKIK